MYAHSMGSVRLFLFSSAVGSRAHKYLRAMHRMMMAQRNHLPFAILNAKIHIILISTNVVVVDVVVVAIVGFSVHRSFVVSTCHICLFVRRTVMPQQHFHQRFPRLSTSLALNSPTRCACVRLKRNINGSGTTPMASNHQLVFDKIRSCWLSRFC